MRRAENKATRLLQIEALLLAEPLGLTQAELARRLGVNRSTILRNLSDLPGHVIQDDSGRLFIDRKAYLVNIRLNLNEALALHMATRLLATRMDRQNPHAASALRKLGLSLELLAPRISHHMLQSANLMDDPLIQRQDPAYLAVLERLTLAWAEQKLVHVWHRHEDGIIYEYDFAPYFIEPYAIGRSSHVIGWRNPPEALRTFKIERLERVELLDEFFTQPSDFDPSDFLRNAWGIWFTDQDPVDVVLKFGRRVANRVRETRWHRTEQVESLPDGSLLWRASIAEPREMLPWIRGWGADVEVVEPANLREELLAEVSRLNHLYSLSPEADDPILKNIQLCWGKTSSDTSTKQTYHPALFHMIDTGNVARQLLLSSSSRWRFALGAAFSIQPDELSEWLPWLIASHDIGKISSSFQRENQIEAVRMSAQGFTFGTKLEISHSSISHAHIGSQIQQWFPNLPESLMVIWREAVGGHHGIFTKPDDLSKTVRRLRMDEPAEWSEYRNRALKVLAEEFYKKPLENWNGPDNISAAIMTLAGFLILCDWLASNQNWFAPEPEISLGDYRLLSEQRAKNAVKMAGLLSATNSDSPTEFGALFSTLKRLRPLQLAIDEIPTAIFSAPCLAIIEAPTGEGKTEAALALAHRIARSTGSDEIYYALPTTATSNQMFVRINHHIRKHLDLEGRAKLIHGQAMLVEDDLLVKPMENGHGNDQSDPLEWFSPKKLALLAPFGVGTIDQAELAALNVRHVALRQIGLAGKVVILDEVHAYDVYMTTVIEGLLNWLSKTGASVILLSATLPSARRASLAKAYGHNMQIGEGYPNIWVGSPAGVFNTSPKAFQPDRQIELNFLNLEENDVEAKADWLLSAASEGGCVCWITNTVNRAQQLYQAVVNRDQTVVCILLHARFPLADRQRIEQEITACFGPQGKRPTKAIVIGTQVLEQSLDLDFDLIVSDIAPVDLLLQRAGRLHRHAHHSRPLLHQVPRLWVALSLDQNGTPDCHIDSLIYDEYILRKTWQQISKCARISLPADYREWIESVYSSKELEESDSLFAVWKKFTARQKRYADEAHLRLLPDPHPRDPFCSSRTLNFEENEDKAGWFIAKTRMGEPSLTVLPLEREGQSAFCPGVSGRLDLSCPVDRMLQLELLRHTLRISGEELSDALKSNVESLPVLFKESRLLKDIHPLWLQNGKAQVGNYSMRLDANLGLVIEKKGGKVHD